MSSVVGWDIGGAHLKACLLNKNGVVEQTIQVSCPLWRGLDQLRLAIDKVKIDLQIKCDVNVVTMTGELADCFVNRHVGVCEIAKLACNELGDNTLFYAGKLGFVTANQVSENTKHIASMNWHASASWLALKFDEALLMDIGSTTTDLIPLKHGKVIDVGYNDAQRMASDALVYTGMVRTPLMAVAQKIPFLEVSYHVAAEHFATTADVYRLLRALPLAHDLAETADGQGKSVTDSARRLARMVGYDFEDYPMDEWVALANNFKRMQIKQLTLAVETVQNIPPKIMIGAGLGHALVREIATSLNIDFVSVKDLIQSSKSCIIEKTVVSFPAFAVAALAIQYGTN